MSVKEKAEDFIVEVTEATIDSNCFTLTKFAEYLTNNYTKASGADFTPHEAKEFANKGRHSNNLILSTML